MYQIKIGYDKYRPCIEAIGSLKTIWQIYWHFYTSVQSIKEVFYVQVIDLHVISYIDITKGTANITYCSEDFIKCTKDISYMKDRIKTV